MLCSRRLGSSQARGNEAKVVNLKYLMFFLVALFVFLAFACTEKANKSSLPKLGTAAVEFKLQDVKGQTWSLDRVKGKVVLLRFWADWCPHCRYEMPVIEKYYRMYKKQGFEVLAVNDKQSPGVVEAFTAQLDITFPALLDLDGKMAQGYGIYAIPTNFLIDRQGTIREILVGEVLKEEKSLRDLLKNYFKM
jgi:cytochrome c biogenesis protein CcmG/thiol:disulfide interchange protein DsbE